MADRRLGMAHVTDAALARLADSVPPLAFQPPRPRLLPVIHAVPEQLGFSVDDDVVLAEVYAVHEGRRIAVIELRRA